MRHSQTLARICDIKTFFAVESSISKYSSQVKITNDTILRLTHENGTSTEVPSSPDSFLEKKDPCCHSRTPSVLVRGKDGLKLARGATPTYMT